MEPARILSFVLPLGCDTLAIAIALGLRGTAWLRPALVFTTFETVMPVLGIFAGRVAGERLGMPAHLFGGIVLLALGAHVIREALQNDDEAAALRFDSWRAAAIAGMAISTDELAVGFPLGTAGLPVTPLLCAIALQTFVVTAAGISIGRRLGERLGRGAARGAGIVAGIAFCALGASLAIEALRP